MIWRNNVFYFSLKFLTVIAVLLIFIVSPSFSQSSDSEAESMLKEAYDLLEAKNFDESEILFIKIRESGYITPQAWNGLGQVYLSLGRSKVLILESLKKLMNQDNYSKAEKCFVKAFEGDSTNIDPLYNLGKTFLGKEDGEKAIGIFTRVLEKDPAYKDTPFQLGLGYMLTKDYEAAEDALKSGLMREGDVAKTRVYLAEVFFKKKKNFRASKMYLEGMAKLVDPVEMDRQFEYMRILLSDSLKKVIEAIPIEEKGPFIVEYWNRKDPDPTTDENERLIEHFRRIDYSFEAFSSKLYPGYDDRGKIFIKYGEPDQRYISNDESWTYGGESWSYNSIHEYLSYDFVERGHNYFLVKNLGQIVRGSTPASGMHKNTYIRRQYEQRSHLNANYARMAQVERTGANGGLDMINELREFDMRVEDAIQKSPVERFTPFDKPKLPFDIRMAEFKGRDNNTRIELYYSLFFKNLEFTELPNYLGFKSNANTYFVLQDENNNEVFRKTAKYPLLVSFEPETKSQNIIKVDSVEVPPGNYSLYFKIKNAESEREGMFQIRMEARGFDDSNLSMSDIQFSLDENSADKRFKIEKNDVTIYPYPFQRVLISRPILTYFEVYNLTLDNNGKSKYEIEYVFWKDEKKKKKIQSTKSNIRGDKRNDVSLTGLDLKKMKPGNYVLEIIIIDKISDKRTSVSTNVELL